VPILGILYLIQNFAFKRHYSVVRMEIILKTDIIYENVADIAKSYNLVGINKMLI
jgi:hypothetical protein